MTNQNDETHWSSTFILRYRDSEANRSKGKIRLIFKQASVVHVFFHEA